MSALDLGTLDPDRNAWVHPVAVQQTVSRPLRRNGFGRAVDGSIRLEEPNIHSRLRLVNQGAGSLAPNTTQRHGGIRLAHTASRRHHRLALAAKRSLDLGLGSASLLLLTPLLFAVAAAIKLQSDGPVFYSSERVGEGGRLFRCHKFRTMVRDADSLRQKFAHLNEREGILFKISKDPRVTPLGAWLRKYSLDELPQLFNVLRGEMSLVGPRPSLSSEVDKYEPHHLRRLSVMPGMTGLWQVEARSNPSFDSYIALDCKYADEWSLWLDLKILARTVRVVLLGTGV